jgi:MazG family protein
LLQVVFHAQIGEEEDRFTIQDVIGHIHEKLVRRHPHVFGDVDADTSEKVLKNWEAIKMDERNGQRKKEDATASVLDGVPSSLPALLKAQRVQTKVGRVGFDWESTEGALKKVHEELAEVEATLQKEDADALTHELGDLFFSLVNVARHCKVDAEGSLRASVAKFMDRFQYIEASLTKKGLTPQEVDLATMDALWDEAKSKK